MGAAPPSAAAQASGGSPGVGGSGQVSEDRLSGSVSPFLMIGLRFLSQQRGAREILGWGGDKQGACSNPSPKRDFFFSESPSLLLLQRDSEEEDVLICTWVFRFLQAVGAWGSPVCVSVSRGQFLESSSQRTSTASEISNLKTFPSSGFQVSSRISGQSLLGS